jgi:hypothetical protein
MLWYDSDPKTSVTEKLDKAIEYYKKKYDETPTLAFTHPGMFAKVKQDEQLPIELRPDRGTPAGHFRIGMG